MVLQLRVEASGGTHFTKAGLIKAVGATPLFFIGGAAVSYTLFNGLSGWVRAGVVVAEYTDEARVTQLRERLAEIESPAARSRHLTPTGESSRPGTRLRIYR